jgi:hypothetical protein
MGSFGHFFRAGALLPRGPARKQPARPYSVGAAPNLLEMRNMFGRRGNRLLLMILEVRETTGRPLTPSVRPIGGA